MRRVIIWATESDNDKEVVKHLAPKLAAHLDIEVDVQTVGKKAFTRVAKKVKSNPAALEKAVGNYLKKFDCVIFIRDTDSPIRLKRRRQDKNSAISQIERVRDKFEGQVHLALAVHEIEAWLLVDCLGICCYFAKVENSSKPRERQAQKFQSLLRNYRKGNTELIVEAESGGKGPKEYLIGLSEKILRVIDPKIKRHKLNDKKYEESLSPKIAAYIEINSETLSRNKSLRQFGDYLKQCSSAA